MTRWIGRNVIQNVFHQFWWKVRSGSRHIGLIEDESQFTTGAGEAALEEIRIPDGSASVATISLCND